MSIRSFITGVATDVVADPRTETMLEKLLTTVALKVIADPATEQMVETLLDKLITTRLVPVIPVAIGAAIDQAYEHLSDLNQNGKPDVSEVVDAATGILHQFLPPWLKIPGLGINP